MSRHSMGRTLASSLPLVSPSMTAITTTSSSSLPLSQSYSRCDELRVRIHENHLSYLNRDETPSKLEMRTKIECLIAEYLSLVSHNQKFSLIEVSNCLNRSITENKEFSAYKACGAFEALEKYATNLLTHPWRREYQSICPYSGFYRHVVERHIVGAEDVLALMGFVHNTTKGIYEMNESPIDPDKVSLVALECLVAFVELQIMIQIRESLKSKGFSSISWREIYGLRVEYICGQSDAIKLICEMKRTAKLIDYENSSGSNAPKRLISVNSEKSLLSNGYSLIDDHLSPQRQSHRNKQLAHHYIHDNYDDEDDAIESFDLLNYPIISPISPHSFPLNPSCQYCLPHSSSLPICPPPPLTSYVTPTLFAPFPTTTTIQTVNKGIQAEMPKISNEIEGSFTKMNIQSNNKISNDIEVLASHPTNSKNSQTRRDSLNASYDKSGKRGSFYDNLDPLISLESNILSEFKSNSKDNKQSDKKCVTSEKTEKSLNSLEKKKKIEVNNFNKIINSIKPHSTHGKSTNDKNCQNNVNTSEVIETGLSDNSVNTTSKLGLNSNNSKTRSDEAKCDKNRILKGWSCSSCTYFNSDSKDVCEICHRSRKSGNEAMPLISGGRECSRCTLVNDKEEKFCRACDTSLADSPTYI